MNLTSISIRIDQIDSMPISFAEKWHLAKAFRNFVKPSLALGMFVPCDLEGNVLDEPESHRHQINFDEWEEVFDEKEVQQYQQAKERVLFEGFELSKIKSNEVFWFKTPYDDCYYNPKDGAINTPAYDTIESLVEHYWVDITLTKSAIKQIGL